MSTSPAAPARKRIKIVDVKGSQTEKDATAIAAGTTPPPPPAADVPIPGQEEESPPPLAVKVEQHVRSATGISIRKASLEQLQRAVSVLPEGAPFRAQVLEILRADRPELAADLDPANPPKLEKPPKKARAPKGSEKLGELIPPAVDDKLETLMSASVKEQLAKNGPTGALVVQHTWERKNQTSVDGAIYYGCTFCDASYTYEEGTTFDLPGTPCTKTPPVLKASDERPAKLGKHTATAEEELIAEKTPTTPPGGQVIVNGKEIQPTKAREPLIVEVPTTLQRVAAQVKAEAPRADVLGLSTLRESPTNPRRTFGPSKELEDSVRAVGILQPLLVRPAPKTMNDAGLQFFEVVCGARRLRAAKAVGLLNVPVVIRELSDLQALECQIVENVQREDVHPLEEADAYATLHHKHGYSVDEISAKTGKTKATIYARMKLTALSEHGRKLVYDGKLSPSVALLVARIPGEKLQAEAVKELFSRWGEKPGAREAEETLQRLYTLDLKQAPFDTDDALLLGEVGACGPCPFRSGNCREVTPDIKSADVCTSPSCYARKVEAHTVQLKARAEGKGMKWLAAAEAKKLLGHDGRPHWNGELVELGAPHPDDDKRRTWKQLLKGTDEELQIVAAVTPGGKLIELVDRKEALKLIKKSAPTTKAAKKDTERAEEKEKLAEEKEKEKLRREVGTMLRQGIAGQAKKARKLELPVLRLVAEIILDHAHAVSDEIAQSRGYKDVDGLERDAEKKLDEAALLGLIAELVIGIHADDAFGGYAPEVKTIAKAYGYDLRELEKEVKASVQAQLELDKGKKAKA